MKNKKILIAVLAMAMLSSMVLITTANAVAFPSLPPDPVNVVFQEGPLYPITGRLPGTATLSNVPTGYDVTNQAYYPAYCSELGIPIVNGQMYLALLTTSPLGHMTQAQWNEINYLINNHSPSLNLQFAIWFVLGFTDADLNAGSWNQAGSYATAHSYANDAIANGAGFTPSNPGQLVAVFINIVDQNRNDLPIQDLIVQLTIPSLGAPGLTPGFWKNNLAVYLGLANGNRGYSDPTGSPTVTKATMGAFFASLDDTKSGPYDLMQLYRDLSPQLDGITADIRNDAANIFNVAAGLSPGPPWN